MKARYWIPASVAVVAVTSFILMRQGAAPPDVQWGFLKGQAPIKDELTEFGGAPGTGVCGHGQCSGDGPPLLERTKEFVYRADYKFVLAQARKEVVLKGGTEFGGVEGAGFRSAGWDLYVSRGRYNPDTGDTDYKAPYVRVTVMATRKDSSFGRWIRKYL